MKTKTLKAKADFSIKMSDHQTTTVIGLELDEELRRKEFERRTGAAVAAKQREINYWKEVSKNLQMGRDCDLDLD
jgi:hypothetical protein